MSHVTLARGVVCFISSMCHALVCLISLRLTTLHSSFVSPIFYFILLIFIFTFYMGRFGENSPVRFREWGVWLFGQQRPSDSNGTAIPVAGETTSKKYAFPKPRENLEVNWSVAARPVGGLKGAAWRVGLAMTDQELLPTARDIPDNGDRKADKPSGYRSLDGQAWNWACAATTTVKWVKVSRCLVNGIIFCVCLTLAISVLQIVLKWCRKERKKIQVKKDSQQSRSRWRIWSRDAAEGLLMC